jgi:hypothetical protein
MGCETTTIRKPGLVSPAASHRMLLSPKVLVTEGEEQVRGELSSDVIELTDYL